MKTLAKLGSAVSPAADWPHRFANRTGRMRRSTIRELLKLTGQPDMISFAGGLPAAELFPFEAVRAAANAVLTEAGGASLQYSESEGFAPLRDWLAARFSRPLLPLSRANVVIFNGGQQALDLIGRLLLDEGDQVLVENPTYLALLSSWRPLGVEFVPLPADDDGICVEQLEPLLHSRPKLLYSVPTFQNPSGTTLSAERRTQLIEVLREHDVALVEDDPYGELRYDGDALPTLFELDARRGANGELDANVLHVGTFSKVLAPGLRIGWVIASEAVVEKLVQARQAADLHTNTFSQHLTYRLLRDGVLDTQIPLLRRAYRERRDAMLAALEKYFPADVTWTKPAGGMFLLVTLPKHIRAADLLVKALEQKVAFVPGEDFHLGGAGQSTLRLNFSNATPELIEIGIRRLAGVLTEG